MAMESLPRKRSSSPKPKQKTKTLTTTDKLVVVPFAASRTNILLPSVELLITVTILSQQKGMTVRKTYGNN